PYFVEIPTARLAKWEPESYLPAGEGSGWSLKRFREPTPATTHDIDHWVWICDGKAFELRNVEDTWGFAGARSWEFNLIGSKLYVYDADEHYPFGWVHTSGGGWTLIPAPKGIKVPADPVNSGVYEIDGDNTKLRADASNYEAFLKGKSGDYYIAPPGEGVVRVFELAPATSQLKHVATTTSRVRGRMHAAQ
ncbi:MAG: hypothetical protein ACRD6W_02395, partial [Nitrososphaerales archaeon]